MTHTDTVCSYQLFILLKIHSFLEVLGFLKEKGSTVQRTIKQNQIF